MHQRKYPWYTETFGRIWALWGLLWFISTMCIAMLFYSICYMVKEPAAARWHRAVSKVWMTFYMNIIGSPLRVKGLANYDPQQNYIVVCNHNSFMDVPVTTPFMPNANKTIAKKEFVYIPIFGWIYGAGSVLVDRKSEQSRKESAYKMKSVLKLGLDMVIYPEGTRNRTNEPLKPFYDGAFRLAVDCKKPIIPAVILYTRDVLPAAKPFFMLPHHIEMHFLPPVYPGGITVQQLKEKVFTQMHDFYKENYKP